MIYLDTNVIISYIDELDSKHENAKKLFNVLESNRVVSKLTLAELTSVFFRANLGNPVVFALYSIEQSGAKVVDVDFNNIITKAPKLAQELKLRILDLLHLIICAEINVEFFATFDETIANKSEDIQKLLKVRVISK
ncbi:MAG: type II toxin-antitoxin system VapC family toxin [Thermoproteota archaeon]